MLRNVAIAMGNSGEEEFLPRLGSGRRVRMRCWRRLRLGRLSGSWRVQGEWG